MLKTGTLYFQVSERFLKADSFFTSIFIYLFFLVYLFFPNQF